MMDEQGMLEEIMKQLQRKYRHMNEIYNLTKDIGKSLSLDDKISTQILLQNRQEEMMNVDQCDRSLGILLDATPLDFQTTVQAWMGTMETAPNDQYGTKIYGIKKNIDKVLEKIIVLDQGMSKRIAGEKSFYSDS